MVKTLFGEGGVQSLDGEAHQHRKAMFMALMTRARVAELASQDLSLEMSRMPALPHSRFVMTQVRREARF